MLTRKPCKNDTITYPSGITGMVEYLDGNLCWCKWDTGTFSPFIWYFPYDKQLNSLATIAAQAVAR